MTRRKAFVTGAGGFLGANLVRRLRAEGHTVIATRRPDGDDWRLDDLAGDVERAELDLSDAHAVSRALARTKPHWIFHLAAYGGYSWEADRNRIVATNYNATVGLLTAAVDAGVEAFVHAGSSSEYGFKDHAPAETELPEPNSDYAAAKAAATLFVTHVGRTARLRASTLRLYSVYGPWEDPRRLIPTLVSKGVMGKLPPLVDPRVARDFVYVADACDALIRAAENAEPGAIYNVGTGVQTTVGELVDLAIAQLDIAETPRWGTMDDRAWDTHVWVANPDRIMQTLGWQPQVGLDDGFRRTVLWLSERPELWRRYGIESDLAWDPFRTRASSRSEP